MRFYPPKSQFYCGVDLHAKTMYVCVVDRQGTIVVHQNVRTDAQAFLKLLAPYRHDIVVAVECMHSWYWLADLCAAERIEFALGHALYMGAIHGGKTKNDRIDAEKIARLTQGGLLPMAYVYPPQERGLRDLLRRRLRFVRLRAELSSHVQAVYRQANQSLSRASIRNHSRRAEVPEALADRAVRANVAADLELMTHFDSVIRCLEEHLQAAANQRYAKELALLQTIPGVGPITALTLVYEMHTVERFDRRQQFASYCRLVKPRHESAGKLYGAGGSKIGNPYLKWAFSEAAVHAAQFNPRIKKRLARLESRYGPGKGKIVLAHRLGRAVYHMLKKGQVFDEAKFLRS